jgi:hypothetical protein
METLFSQLCAINDNYTRQQAFSGLCFSKTTLIATSTARL